ncbi:hypothetical protein GGX14DRAFT_403154 [Mycena pura]|uniref:Uncharacterized protein n=1 Tax=Mycena pura TaxID=153505 RepID=A0AAD6UWG4_9AGAR|nr:hypothetical protein GGX14DRAFT_403154 [Mycena pura]
MFALSTHGSTKPSLSSKLSERALTLTAWKQKPNFPRPGPNQLTTRRHHLFKRLPCTIVRMKRAFEGRLAPRSRLKGWKLPLCLNLCIVHRSHAFILVLDANVLFRKDFVLHGSFSENECGDIFQTARRTLPLQALLGGFRDVVRSSNRKGKRTPKNLQESLTFTPIRGTEHHATSTAPARAAGCIRHPYPLHSPFKACLYKPSI